MRAPITIRDIASHLGISHATVSRVLNGKGADFISDATRKRVLEASEKMGYRRNYHARALHLGRADAVGVAMLLIPGSNGWRDFWGRIVDGVAQAASVHGKELVAIGSERPQEGVIERCLLRLQERRIDCLVLPGALDLKPHIQSFRDAGAPVVVAQHYDEKLTGLSSVRLDSEPGVRAAMEHLLGLGHRRIAWLGPATASSESKRRRATYRAAMEKAGQAPQEWMATEAEVMGKEWPMARAISLARETAALHLAAAARPTAVMCFNESMAQGVYAAAVDAGLRVPRDLSVIGFDDVHAEFATPAMTVVSHMLPEIGRRAAELAMELALAPAGEPREERIAAALVVRDSTGPAKG